MRVNNLIKAKCLVKNFLDLNPIQSLCWPFESLPQLFNDLEGPRTISDRGSLQTISGHLEAFQIKSGWLGSPQTIREHLENRISFQKAMLELDSSKPYAALAYTGTALKHVGFKVYRLYRCLGPKNTLCGFCGPLCALGLELAGFVNAYWPGPVSASHRTAPGCMMVVVAAPAPHWLSMTYPTPLRNQ